HMLDLSNNPLKVIVYRKKSILKNQYLEGNLSNGSVPLLFDESCSQRQFCLDFGEDSFCSSDCILCIFIIHKSWLILGFIFPAHQSIELFFHILEFFVSQNSLDQIKNVCMFPRRTFSA